MIVDDSEIVLAVTQYALQSAGYDVVIYQRTSGCIEMILREQPDLLLIDVNMPGLNGDALVNMLGSSQAISDMIVLLHSGLTDDVLARKAAASHAHGYVRKSDNPQDMISQVSRWLRPGTYSGVHQTELAVAEVNIGSKDTTVATSGKFEVAERVAGKILLVEQDMMELSGLRRLLKSQPCAVEFAISGKEVLRRLRTECPPDVVVLGRLIGSPNVSEVVHSAAQLNSRWKSRLIIVRDDALNVTQEALDVLLAGHAFTHLCRPLTETSLCGAIQSCLQYAG